MLLSHGTFAFVPWDNCICTSGTKLVPVHVQVQGFGNFAWTGPKLHFNRLLKLLLVVLEKKGLHQAAGILENYGIDSETDVSLLDQGDLFA